MRLQRLLSQGLSKSRNSPEDMPIAPEDSDGLVSLTDHEMTSIRGTEPEVADLQEAIPIPNAAGGPGDELPCPPVPACCRPGKYMSVPSENLSSVPRNVGDGQVVAVHVCQAEVANLHEVSPEGDTMRKPDRPIPRIEVCSGSWVQRSIASEDLCSPAIAVRDTEVVWIDGCQTKLAELHEAVAPCTKALIAGAEGHIADLRTWEFVRGPTHETTAIDLVVKGCHVIDVKMTIAVPHLNQPVGGHSTLSVQYHHRTTSVAQAKLADLEIPQVSMEAQRMPLLTLNAKP